MKTGDQKEEPTLGVWYLYNVSLGELKLSPEIPQRQHEDVAWCYGDQKSFESSHQNLLALGVLTLALIWRFIAQHSCTRHVEEEISYDEPIALILQPSLSQSPIKSPLHNEFTCKSHVEANAIQFHARSTPVSGKTCISK